ncbi:MAG: diguanylate cyclase, partial [Thermoplasmata archaeon]|nr:diguanylate cyclase [Thermoplasmata archaeon]NIW81279.1 diguanylate cyclase [Thermoplasmata archaeon]
MSLEKRWDGYTSFSYLEPGTDYRAFELADQLERVPAYRLPLSDEEEARVAGLADECL